MESLPNQIKVRFIGLNVILAYGKEKHILVSDTKEQREKIKLEIEEYNKRPSEIRFNKIMRLMKVKTEAIVLKKKVEKKKEKQKVKEAKREKVNIKREVATIKAGGDDRDQYFEGDTRFVKRSDGKYALAKYPQVSFPDIFVDEIIKYKKESTDLSPILNFWHWALLNPNPIARTDAFKYIKYQNFTITPSGMFLTYRRIKIHQTGQDHEKVEFITSNSFRLKAKNQALSNYYVRRTGSKEYELIHKQSKAFDNSFKESENLDYLFNNITSLRGTIYTDAHTGTTRIKIGKEVSISREECDSSRDRTCSAGLHVGAASWVGTGYIGERSMLSAGTFGDIKIACLINPMNIVSVPYNEAYKMRCCEYFPIAVVSGEDIMSMENSEQAIKLFDYNYASIGYEQLQKMLEKTKLTEFIDKAETRDKELKLEELERKLKALKEIKLPTREVVNKELSIQEIDSLIEGRRKLLR